MMDFTMTVRKGKNGPSGTYITLHLDEESLPPAVDADEGDTPDSSVVAIPDSHWFNSAHKIEFCIESVEQNTGLSAVANEAIGIDAPNQAAQSRTENIQELVNTDNSRDRAQINYRNLSIVHDAWAQDSDGEEYSKETGLVLRISTEALRKFFEKNQKTQTWIDNWFKRDPSRPLGRLIKDELVSEDGNILSITEKGELFLVTNSPS